MKKVGAVGGASIATSLAGCTGDGGSGGDGGSSGGDGGSSGGSDSSGSSSETKLVKLLMAPSGFMGVVMDYLFRDTDKLYQYFEENGLNVELSKSWEGAAIFTAGGADYETFGSLETAMIAAERGIPLTINANCVPQFILIITGAGSEYDPEVAGSAQAGVDKLVENEATFALGGWGGATATAIVLAMQEGFGYTFVDDPSESDFEVTTAEWFAIPQLIERGDAAAGTNSPEHGMAPYAGIGDEEPVVTKLFQIGEVMQEAGLGLPQMNSWTCSQEFTDNWPDSSPALVQAYHEGMTWLYEDPVARVEEDEETHLEQLGATSMEQAEWMIEWGIELELDNEIPMYYKDIELTEEFIETDKDFLAAAQESGYLGPDWTENLQYRTVAQE
ncbi:MAG: hypothetical protein ACQETI_02170 [Halobacteriota archaeon]